MRSIVVIVLAVSACAHAGSRNVTWVGWFSDEGCAKGRANSGVYTATNPECARKCIEQGNPAVFIAEQEKAIYAVKDYAGAKEDLGYKVEVSGILDDEAKTLTVRSVKRLERVSLSCARPKPAH